jgi:alanyl aminopeptidase
LVPTAQRPAYARFVRETFGARAAALGFQPRAGEPADDQLLRPKLLAAVADAGEDAGLRRSAAALARRWLQDRSALPAELAGPVLAIAALDGDAALFETLLAEAKRVTDRRDRRRLMIALGSFRDPALARRALALMMDGDFDVRESVGVLTAAVELEAGRQLAYDYIKENFDALTARLPETYSASAPRFAKGFCDAGRRDDLERFYAGRSTRFLGGPRILAQTLESITLCSALQAAQRPSVAEFLAGFANEPAIDQQREKPIGVRRR